MKNKTCLFPKCTNKGKCRGLCGNHYGAAHRLVAMDNTTWAALEKKGKCLRRGQPRRGKWKNFFMGD